jgi:copper chaperone CopZ
MNCVKRRIALCRKFAENSGMETVSYKVEGMSCNNCALNISRYLEKQGMKDVVVSFATGDLSFAANAGADVPAVLKGIDDLGYHVVNADENKKERRYFLATLKGKLTLSLYSRFP